LLISAGVESESRNGHWVSSLILAIVACALLCEAGKLYMRLLLCNDVPVSICAQRMIAGTCRGNSDQNPLLFSVMVGQTHHERTNPSELP
jgi:hypothetical protein